MFGLSKQSGLESLKLSYLILDVTSPRSTLPPMALKWGLVNSFIQRILIGYLQ